MSDSCCNCSKEIWKEPKKTICFLVLFNIGYLYLRHKQTGLISLFLTLTLYKILISIVLKKFDISCCKSGCCNELGNQEEKIKKNEECILKGINKINDIIEMKENADYKIIGFCILMIFIGETFSSLTVIVLCVDIFVLLSYGKINDLIKENYEKYSKMIIEKIPKFKDEKID